MLQSPLISQLTQKSVHKHYVGLKVAGEERVKWIVSVDAVDETRHAGTFLIVEMPPDGSPPLKDVTELREEEAAVDIDERPSRRQLQAKRGLIRLAPFDQDSDPSGENESRDGLGTTGHVADDLRYENPRTVAV